MRLHGWKIIATMAVLCGCAAAAASASAAETITLRTAAGAITTQKVSATGKFSLVAEKHTITCSASALEGYGGLLENGASAARDELSYQGWSTGELCSGSWTLGSSVEVEMFTQYLEVTFLPDGRGRIACSEDCDHQTMNLYLGSDGDRCSYEFQEVPFKFKAGKAGAPKAVKTTFSDKILPSSFGAGCPTRFTIKGSYSWKAGTETLLSEAV